MKPRDLMAPDTDPTDEKLALVTHEARQSAVRKRARADEWVAQQLGGAARYAS